MAREGVLARRRAERERLIESARAFAAEAAARVPLLAAVVFGSVARGDFNVWSDADLLLVAEELPDRPLDRLDALGARPPLVQPVAWTPDEWRTQVARGNPIAREALERGVWLVGSADAIPTG